MSKLRSANGIGPTTIIFSLIGAMFLCGTSYGVYPQYGPITLESHVTIADFNAHPNLSDVEGCNDIWGYTSPSGRKYAIVGLYTGSAFVEITDPTSPVIVAAFGRGYTWWRDLKTYGTYAYVVADGAGGDIYVYDLSDIDNGNVTLAHTENAPIAHNISIDTDSGFLYQCGGPGADKGLRIFDLSNPADPAYVGRWSTRYVHDVQVVTYDGPDTDYSGKQIAFCASPNDKLDILDVTNKTSIVVIASLTYSPDSYSHSGWLSPDQKYFYHADEDYGALGTNRIRIFDVSDLDNPFLAATTTNGNSGMGHNVFTKGDYLYQSAYQTGIRIYDISDPIAPTEIAWFDTFPENDDPSDYGLWGTYPYFEDGIVVGSDYTGLFVWKFPSPSVCGDLGTYYYPNDFTLDCYVELDDLAILAGGYTGTLADVQSFVSEWLLCSDPDNPSCL